MLGAALLCATTMFHSEQVELVFSWLTAPPEAAWISRAMYTAAPLVIASAVLNAARTTGVGAGSRNEFIIVLVSALCLPPITFFVLYFCLVAQHPACLRHSRRTCGYGLGELFQAGWRYAAIAIVSSLLWNDRIYTHRTRGPQVLCHPRSFRWLR